MATWEEVITEIGRVKDPFSFVIQKYLHNLSKYTKRNTIVYYSAFLSKPNQSQTDVNDLDMNGFMSAVNGLDCRKGLDLIIHTPGGSPVAAESIVKYLRSKFGTNIRVIVPHLAMSAGTMIAFSAKEIIMARHSSLGPIDPQFNGIPALGIKEEFEEAEANLASDSPNFGYWKLILDKYPIAFLKMALNAIDLSFDLSKEWLGTGMFDGKNPSDQKAIDKIIKTFNENKISKTHSRHHDYSYCKEAGLKVKLLEEDQKFQDLVLSVHHALTHALNATNVFKIIQNNNGKAWLGSSD